jgi:two-component system cell cycle sensor histidine kinase/response regulator CckA
VKNRARAVRAPHSPPQHDPRDCERRLRLLDRQIQVLERERQKLSAIVSHADAGFLVFDESLRVQWANNIFASRFCSADSPTSVDGAPCHAVLCRLPAPCEECPAARPFRSGIVAHHELRQDLEGQVRYLYATAMPIKSLRGTVEQTIVMLQDVSRLEVLRKSQEALIESEARYRNLFNSITDAVIVTDPQRRIIDANPAFTDQFGFSLEEMRGRPTLDLYVDPAEFGAFGDVLSRLQPDHTVIRTLRFRRKSGEEFLGESAAFQLKDRGGAIKGYVGLIRDVSERGRLEERLRQSQKMEAIGRLAGGVAHDFNNLLTVIMGHSGLLMAGLRDQPALQTRVDQISRAGDRATSLTRQLLAFSRKQILAPSVLDLNVIARDMEAMLKRLIGEDVRLETITRPDLGRVMADRGQIEQVIMNLAVNARDAMPGGGKLTIETDNVALEEDYTLNRPGARPGEYVMLSVSDTGVGMDAETKAHLFEPFFTTKGRGKGTGLGLATVYGIVKQSNGYIWVYSEPGKGTTFKIHLPRVWDQCEEPESAAKPAAELAGTETVLVVEDEEAVRNLVRSILESTGRKVLDAAEGAEAIRIAREHQGPIHLLLTDVIMPGLSGREVAEKVSSLRPETAILYMSGYTDEEIARHGVVEAGIALLEKPFTPDRLKEKVAEILRPSPVRGPRAV